MLLVEEMFTDGVAEILVGITNDPQFGQVLVLGAGGVFTEIMADSVSLLPPWRRHSIEAGLRGLSIAKLFRGYRGKPPRMSTPSSRRCCASRAMRRQT